jgi:hypothetical protein
LLSHLHTILEKFRTEGTFLSASRIGSGHINDSYLVTTTPASASDYVLQRINHSIFKNVPGLMANILHVTRHLEKKLAHDSLHPFHALRLIPTLDGDFFHTDDSGNCWRLYNHIPGSRSFDIVENTELAFEGGKAFGLFQRLNADVAIDSLVETIPGFHNIAMRIAAFREAAGNDHAGRAGSVAEEIAFVEQRADEMHRILRMGEAGLIPVRVTHNDTKFNNILFDAENHAICIVDLDTVMPGYSLYDFGDAIRTGANTAAEDERDLSKVAVNLSLFEAYARGYLSECGKSLVSAEIENLVHSANFMTYLIGVRFLTDYLNGDTYYRIHRPDHNLERARVQFTLLKSMEDNFEAMEKAVKKLSLYL